MKKLESSLLNMILSLGGITIVVSVLLAWVNEVTRDPIRQAERQVQGKGIAAVLPEHDNDPMSEKFEVILNQGTPDSVTVVIYPARIDGKLSGAAVEAMADGFSDKIAVIYGFSTAGTVLDYAVLKQAETPGLGSKMQDWFRDTTGRRSVLGRNPGTEDLTVAKDGGTVDAITAATISSRAFLETLNRAFKAYREYAEKEKGGEK